MKLKDGYYSQQGWEQKIISLGSWLRMKDDFYWHHTALMHHFGVKLQPKHRHRRSVTARMMNQICGYTAFREEAHKRRLFVY